MKRVLIFVIAVIVLSIVFYCKKSGVDKITVYDRNVKFENGIEFLGCVVDKEAVMQGDRILVDYLWKIENLPEERIFVFVHFLNDDMLVFQNDHPLLSTGVKQKTGEDGDIWEETYRTRVPLDAPVGEYDITLGLYLPDSQNKRVPVSCSESASIGIGKLKVLENKLPEGLKGSLVFQSDAAGNNEIYLMDIADRKTKRLTFGNANNEYPSFSPDGKQILFSSYRDGNNEIYIMDADGNNQRRLTVHPANDVSPSWCPDGERIIFVSDRDGAMNFYFMNKDGSGVEKITDFEKWTHDMPRISPDGKKILFTSDMSLGWQVFIFDIETKDVRQLTRIPAGHCDAVWSNDGKQIAYIKRLGTGNSDIWVMDSNGENARNITAYDGLDYKMRFSPDDEKLVYSSEIDGNWEIYVIGREWENPVRITYSDAGEEWVDWKYRR